MNKPNPSRASLFLSCAFCSVLLATAGCNITRVGGDPQAFGVETTTRYLDGDTNRVESVTTTPRVAYSWWGNSYRNCMDTQIQSLAMHYGDATASVNGYGSTVNVEAVKAIADAATDITAKVCAAIATHGGSAAASGVSSLVSKFLKAGGKAENATVTCKDGSCTITDGSVTCDGGGCYDCGDGSCVP